MNFRTLWHPSMYQGHGKKAPYFEGWYYKLIGPRAEERYAIIPGIFKHADEGEAHCFVQVLNGMTGESHYHRYPVSEFYAARDTFDVRVGPNRFSADHFELAIDRPEQKLHGVVHFDGITPWPVRPWSPGVMGWYGLIPTMECYHGVLSFDHAIKGALTIDDAVIDFSGGRGYHEKDWGQAFPRGYVWMQSNHFAHSKGTSLSASVALIPWRNRAFRGFIVGLWHGGMLFRFATYTGATIDHLTLSDTHVHWTMHGSTGSGAQKGRYRLEIDAKRAGGGLLRAPDRVAMVERIVESLTAEIAVRLVEVSNVPRTLFDGAGRFAGLELGGDLDTVLDGYGGRVIADRPD